MAYSAAKSLRETIEKIIMNQDQYSISPHHQQQIASIYKQAIYLQKNCSFPPMATSLEAQISQVAREAEEVIENFIAECKGLPDKSGQYNTNFNQQLEEIRKRIDSTAMEMRRGVMWLEMKFVSNTTEDEEDWQLSDSSSISFSLAASSSISSILAIASKIKDMDSSDDDTVAIKSRLCGGSSQLQIIPIVGMGGIGKTTLANNVYYDSLTMQYFDVRVWVKVSQDYSKHKIVSSIMYSMKEFIVTRYLGQSDEITIFQSLKYRRYLIVMDDMWSESVWDDVRELFPEDHNGSRIILTTRLSDVAAYPDSHSPLHQMRFMSIDQSWDLLRQKVFVDKDCPHILENTGKRIAGSCRGLPLAIVMIAGVLSMVEKNLVSWWKIARNVSSIVGTENFQFEEILSLSYTHLPDHLRHCFLYMGGFPEDHKIRISKLVKLLVADDFWIQSKGKGSSKSLEEEAEECLEELVKRNLVLVTERKFDGKIKSCSLHDLIRDMCIRKAQENKFFLNLVDTYVGKEEHFIEVIKDHPRISVKSSSLTYLSSPYCSTIHTVMCFRNIFMELDFLKRVRSLRVLDVENLYVESLPDELFDLFHLRYLAIDFMYGCKIPAAISKLQNLQTLIIDAKNMWKLYERDFYHRLPQEIWMMQQLRHIICYSRLPDPAEATSTLENLQTLSLVSLDMSGEGILEKIPNIKKLGIDCSSYACDTHLNNLVHLHQLESLKLRNAYFQKVTVSFPKMLGKLTLCNMSLPWSEMSIVGSLPNLRVLKLRDLACIGSTWETSEGEFPELQFLLIETSMLQHWITESHHFPRLKFLFLHDCLKLNEIPEGIGEIETLELIDVKGLSNPVPESLAESAKRIIEEQESLGNDALQVHYPSPKPKFGR